MFVQRVSGALLLVLSLGVVVGCGDGDDDDGPKKNDGPGGSIGEGGSDGDSTGGPGPGTPGTLTAMCPAGTENYYDSWYSVPDCKAYYDCVIEASCAASPNRAQCEMAAQTQLRNSYCLPEGSNVPPESWVQICASARQAIAASYPECQ